MGISRDWLVSARKLADYDMMKYCRLMIWSYTVCLQIDLGTNVNKNVPLGRYQSLGLDVFAVNTLQFAPQLISALNTRFYRRNVVIVQLRLASLTPRPSVETLILRIPERC